jgi:hypothetical protein
MNFGIMQGRNAFREESEQNLKKALEIRAKLLASDQENKEYKADYDMTLEKLRELREKGKLEDKAEDKTKEGVAEEKKEE